MIRTFWLSADDIRSIISDIFLLVGSHPPVNNQNSVSEDAIKASLQSAVEDKLRRRLKENFDKFQVRIVGTSLTNHFHNPFNLMDLVCTLTYFHCFNPKKDRYNNNKKEFLLQKL